MSRHPSRPLPQPSTRPRLLLGAALASLVLLAGTLPAATRAQDEPDAKNFEREWQLLQYRDANGTLTQVPPGIGVTMLPYRGTMKGEGACSTFGAVYTLAEETVIVDAPEVDARGCDAAGQAIDDAFYQGLSDTRKWSTRGSILTLQDEIDTDVMILTRAKLPTDPTLARWGLARLGAADGSVEPVIQGTEPWVEFLRGGRVVGSTGCGSFVGSYVTNDTTMSIHGVEARLTDCPEAVRDQAETVLATFDEITDFKVRPAGLVLEDASGTTRMALVPSIDLGRRTWTPTEVLGDDGEVRFGSDRLVTSAVKFLGGKADGRSICRGFKGGSVRSGLALSTFDLVLEGPDCPKPTDDTKASSQEVEDAFVGALELAASHALRGDELELMDVEGRPVMRLTPQAELVGPTWVVTEMDITPGARKQKLRAPTGTALLTVIFDDVDNGFVQGETGVTGYFGDYVTPGAGQIAISNLDTFSGCTGKAASKPPCKQQQLFLDLMQSADSFIVEPAELRLFKGTRKLLGFTPSQTLPNETTAVEEPVPTPES